MLDRRQMLGAGLAAAALSAAGPLPAWAARARESGAGFTPLFNGRDLDGWYTFLATSGRNVDPARSVRVTKGMLHVLGFDPTDAAPEAGYLATDAAYANYHLRVEYRWGERRFPPRALYKRDNGILYHLTGEDHVWPVCMEFQVQESDVGDAIGVGGALGQGGVRFTPGLSDGIAGFRSGPPGLPAWPDLPRQNNPMPTTSNLRKQGDFEDHTGGWNVLELICMGDKAAHIVNGRVVASAFNIESRDPADPTVFHRMDRGRIALEIEYAETFFRKIELKQLPAG